MRTLARGKTKVSILTTAPKNIFAPTVTELNAGIDASCAIVADTFRWRATESETISEAALCDESNSEALGASNYEGYVDVWRYYDDTSGAIDPAKDKVFEALKTKGTTVYIYARRNSKKATEPWVAGDEIFLGGSALTDTPQAADNTDGYIKYGIKLLPQQVDDFLTVGAGA